MNQLTLSAIRAASWSAAGVAKPRRAVAAAKTAAPAVALSALLFGLAACASPEVPVERWAGWFAHVEGADLKARCGDGRTRWRLVYNGNYRLQIRSYELVPDAAGGAELTVLVRNRPSLFASSLEDPFAAYRPAQGSSRLAPAEAQALMQAIGRDIAAAPPAGLRLPSDEVYWLLMGCDGGRFRYDAVARSSPRWRALSFPPLLLAADATGIALTEPDRPCYGASESPAFPGCEGVLFTLTVTADGLAPMPHLR